jgi:hypothetical protein
MRHDELEGVVWVVLALDQVVVVGGDGGLGTLHRVQLGGREGVE